TRFSRDWSSDVCSSDLCVPSKYTEPDFCHLPQKVAGVMSPLTGLRVLPAELGRANAPVYWSGFYWVASALRKASRTAVAFNPTASSSLAQPSATLLTSLPHSAT